MADLDERVVLQALFEHGNPDQASDQEHQTRGEEQRPQQVGDVPHLGEIEKGQGGAQHKQQCAETDGQDGLQEGQPARWSGAALTAILERVQRRGGLSVLHILGGRVHG